MYASTLTVFQAWDFHYCTQICSNSCLFFLRHADQRDTQGPRGITSWLINHRRLTAEGGRPPVHTHSLLTAHAAVRGNKVTHRIRLAGHGPADLLIVLQGDQRVTVAEHLRS